MDDHGAGWLTAGQTLDATLMLRPELYDHLRSYMAVVWDQALLDPVALELCRLRVAGLLGCEPQSRLRYAPARDAGLSEGKIAELSRWPTSDQFSDSERALLAFTEQFVLDPTGVEDDLRDRALEHISFGALVAFVQAIGTFDGLARTYNIFGLTESDDSAEGPVTVPSPNPAEPLR